MRTVGEMLRETRQEKSLRLEEVEEATKIRLKFLEAIERDDFRALPSLSYAKGFVKNYSEFLGLDSIKILAFFRRQIADVPKSSLLPKGVEHPLNRTFLQLTPGRFITGIVVALIIIFLGYLGFQYRSLQQPPMLNIASPVNQQVVTDNRIDVLGTTNPDATVTVNGISVLVRDDGKFFDQIQLDPGVNKVVIVAISRYGKTTSVIREVGVRQ